jgi:replicative DNA helicase
LTERTLINRARANGRAAHKEPCLLSLAALLDEWELDAKAAHEARVSGTPRGPVTGFAKLDDALGGALQHGPHVVHGQPGAGKTAFVLQVATQCGCRVLYVTCEMRPLELLRRLTARVTETYFGRLKSGEFRPSDSLEKARQAVAAVPDLALADATQAYTSPSWIENAARAHRGEQRHLLVVIDSVHSWAETIPADASEYEALGAAIAELRSLAARLECPILAVAERNHASMQGGGLSASAGHRNFEYRGELVLDLKRVREARPDGMGEVDVPLELAKNRNGAIGDPILLKFNGALQRFREA